MKSVCGNKVTKWYTIAFAGGWVHVYMCAHNKIKLGERGQVLGQVMPANVLVSYY